MESNRLPGDLKPDEAVDRRRSGRRQHRLRPRRWARCGKTWRLWLRSDPCNCQSKLRARTWRQQGLQGFPMPELLRRLHWPGQSSACSMHQLRTAHQCGRVRRDLAPQNVHAGLHVGNRPALPAAMPAPVRLVSKLPITAWSDCAVFANFPVVPCFSRAT